MGYQWLTEIQTTAWNVIFVLNFFSSQMFGNFLVMLRREDNIVPFISLLRVDSKSNDRLNKNSKCPRIPQMFLYLKFTFLWLDIKMQIIPVYVLYYSIKTHQGVFWQNVSLHLRCTESLLGSSTSAVCIKGLLKHIQDSPNSIKIYLLTGKVGETHTKLHSYNYSQFSYHLKLAYYLFRSSSIL